MKRVGTMANWGTGTRTLAVSSLFGLLAACGSSDGGSTPDSSSAGSAGTSTGSAGNSSNTSTGGGAMGGGANGSAGTAGATTGTGSPPPAKGLGTACSSSDDCSSPLECHIDQTDYIADMQCALYCDSDDTCTAAFGKSSFCIGANVCVHSCTTDADCSAKTHCNDAGWCERSGAGSGVPYCGGTPTPCAGQTKLSCIDTTGCTDNSECSGVVPSCFSQTDDLSCTQIQGCFWDSLEKSCSGSAEPCSDNFGPETCALQHGCTWTGGCDGVAEACEKQFPSLCTHQPGCVLMTN